MEFKCFHCHLDFKMLYQLFGMYVFRLFVVFFVFFVLFLYSSVSFSFLFYLFAFFFWYYLTSYFFSFQLGLPESCTKVCVLIENVLAAFQMEEILFEVKDRSIGLNCGLWDYSASFINKFGTILNQTTCTDQPAHMRSLIRTLRFAYFGQFFFAMQVIFSCRLGSDSCMACEFTSF